MALTRKFLTALGIEADKIDEIITAHSETVDALKEQRDQYKKDAEALPDVQKELEALQKEKEGNESYKEKYDKEHADFEAYKKDQTDKETKAKKTEAFKALLKEAGVSEKHLGAVLKVSDIDGVELDDKGKIKDSGDRLKSIREEWSDFIVETDKQGAATSTPPEGQGGNGGLASGAGRKLYEQFQQKHYGVKPQNNDNNGGNE